MEKKQALNVRIQAAAAELAHAELLKVLRMKHCNIYAHPNISIFFDEVIFTVPTKKEK